MTDPMNPYPSPSASVASDQPPPPVRRYCVTRAFESTERAYIHAQNETHARVLAEQHWTDREGLGTAVIPASEKTAWQVREVAA